MEDSPKGISLDWEIFIGSFIGSYQKRVYIWTGKYLFVLIKKHIPGYSFREIDILNVFLAVETYQSYRTNGLLPVPCQGSYDLAWKGAEVIYLAWKGTEVTYLAWKEAEVIYLVGPSRLFIWPAGGGDLPRAGCEGPRRRYDTCLSF